MRSQAHLRPHIHEHHRTIPDLTICAAIVLFAMHLHARYVNPSDAQASHQSGQPVLAEGFAPLIEMQSHAQSAALLACMQQAHAGKMSQHTIGSPSVPIVQCRAIWS